MDAPAGAPSAARTLKITLAYDGAPFVGWQRQAEGVSVQGCLEDALAAFEGGPVTVHGAGRTDAGVHALAQVASAEVRCAHPADVLARGLNARLPREVRVTAVQDAAPGFHARFSARAKRYRYLVRHGGDASPFERAWVWAVPEVLDVDAMRAEAAVLVGTNDFAAFRSVGSDVSGTVRTITHADVVCPSGGVHPVAPGGLLAVEVRADGFLRHMVRALAGTLVEIGRGRRPAGTMAALLASRRRAEAGPTAPPQGLFLVAVDYD
jgi:tRNA pseudouridine38-40 synthase